MSRGKAADFSDVVDRTRRRDDHNVDDVGQKQETEARGQAGRDGKLLERPPTNLDQAVLAGKKRSKFEELGPKHVSLVAAYKIAVALEHCGEPRHRRLRQVEKQVQVLDRQRSLFRAE